MTEGEDVDGAGTGDEPPILSERFLESMKAAKATRDGKRPAPMNLASAEGDAAPDPAEAWAPAFHAWVAENNIDLAEFLRRTEPRPEPDSPAGEAPLRLAFVRAFDEWHRMGGDALRIDPFSPLPTEGATDD